MAFLDGNRHQIDAWVEEDSEVFRLPYDRFQILYRENPGIAEKMVSNLALELNRRLREASEEVRNTEES
jgi:CRP-like cAMP-binding protein